MTYALTSNSFSCLKAQVNLCGTFTQILRHRVTRQSINAVIQTEPSQDVFRVEIRMESTVNSLTFPAKDTHIAATVARHLEAIANGLPDIEVVSARAQLPSGAA